MSERPEKEKAKPTAYELFNGPVPSEPKKKDLISDKTPARQAAVNNKPIADSQSGASRNNAVASRSTNGHFFWIILLLVLNSFMIGGVVCYLLVRMDALGNHSQAVHPPAITLEKKAKPQTRVKLEPLQKENIRPTDLFKSVQLSLATTKALDESVSLRTAEALFEKKEYFKAWRSRRRKFSTSSPA